jgi:hypothetical protein
MKCLTVACFALLLLNSASGKGYVKDFVENWPAFKFIGSVVSCTPNTEGHSPFNGFDGIFEARACMKAYVEKSESLFNFTLTCNAAYSDLKPIPYDENGPTWNVTSHLLVLLRLDVGRVTRISLHGHNNGAFGKITLESVARKSLSTLGAAQQMTTVASLETDNDTVVQNGDCECNYRNEFLIVYKKKTSASKSGPNYRQIMRYVGPMVLVILLLWIVRSIIKM